MIADHLRRRFVHFKLGAHFLQARSQRFDLLLLVRGSRLEVPLLLRQSGRQPSAFNTLDN
jgi:hypothetical protein